jgi:hypothetical protein
MIYLLVCVIIIVIIWLSYRYNTLNLSKEKDKYDNFKLHYNKNVSEMNENSIQSIIIKPNNLNTNTTLGNYDIRVMYVEVNMNLKQPRTVLSEPIEHLDETKNIVVYIKYNNKLHSIQLNGKLSDYRNLKSTDLLLNTISTQYFNISYTLSINSIYINDDTEEWSELIISLNKYTEAANDDLLQKDMSKKPIVNNLENPIAEELYRNNRHAYNTPYRAPIDPYGMIYKENQDNTCRTIDTIRKTIDEDNKKN